MSETHLQCTDCDRVFPILDESTTGISVFCAHTGDAVALTETQRRWFETKYGSVPLTRTSKYQSIGAATIVPIDHLTFETQIRIVFKRGAVADRYATMFLDYCNRRPLANPTELFRAMQEVLQNDIIEDAAAKEYPEDSLSLGPITETDDKTIVIIDLKRIVVFDPVHLNQWFDPGSDDNFEPHPNELPDRTPLNGINLVQIQRLEDVTPGNIGNLLSTYDCWPRDHPEWWTTIWRTVLYHGMTSVGNILRSSEINLNISTLARVVFAGRPAYFPESLKAELCEYNYTRNFTVISMLVDYVCRTEGNTHVILWMIRKMLNAANRHISTTRIFRELFALTIDPVVIEKLVLRIFGPRTRFNEWISDTVRNDILTTPLNQDYITRTEHITSVTVRPYVTSNTVTAVVLYTPDITQQTVTYIIDAMLGRNTMISPMLRNDILNQPNVKDLLTVRLVGTKSPMEIFNYLSSDVFISANALPLRDALFNTATADGPNLGARLYKTLDPTVAADVESLHKITHVMFTNPLNPLGISPAVYGDILRSTMRTGATVFDYLVSLSHDSASGLTFDTIVKILSNSSGYDPIVVALRVGETLRVDSPDAINATLDTLETFKRNNTDMYNALLRYKRAGAGDGMSLAVELVLHAVASPKTGSDPSPMSTASGSDVAGHYQPDYTARARIWQMLLGITDGTLLLEILGHKIPDSFPSSSSSSSSSSSASSSLSSAASTTVFDMTFDALVRGVTPDVTLDQLITVTVVVTGNTNAQRIAAATLIYDKLASFGTSMVDTVVRYVQLIKTVPGSEQVYNLIMWSGLDDDPTRSGMAVRIISAALATKNPETIASAIDTSLSDEPIAVTNDRFTQRVANVLGARGDDLVVSWLIRATNEYPDIQNKLVRFFASVDMTYNAQPVPVKEIASRLSSSGDKTDTLRLLAFITGSRKIQDVDKRVQFINNFIKMDKVVSTAVFGAINIFRLGV